jgi:hypothetical protein
LNFNNYYINPANAQLRTGGLGVATTTGPGTSFLGLSNWKTALTATQDANSVQGNPQFLSLTDFHINTAVASVVESAGTPVAGITDDLDGDPRNAVTPDIGADEFAGIPLPANDIAATAFVVPANGGGLFTGTSISPQASFANVGTATQTNIGVQFTISGPGGYAYADNQLIATLASSASTTVTFAAAPTFTTPGAYTMSAVVTTADSNPGNNTINGGFNVSLTVTGGTVTVGTGGTYASLTNPGGVFDGINNGVVTSNITVNILSDLTGETGTIALNEIPGGFTVLSPISLHHWQHLSSIIRLNGADGVTIDGSTTGATGSGVGGTPSIRELTVVNTSPSATAGAVIAVMQGPNSANNITIRNVNVSGQDPTQTLVGIHVGGNTVGASPTVASNLNVVIDNCTVTKAILGIFDNGVSAAVPATGHRIGHNDLSATGTNRLRRAGIFFFFQNGIEVFDNKIGGIVADEAADAIGIIAGIQNVTTTSTTSGGVYNSLIVRNLIDGITSTNTTGFSAVGIAIAGDALGANTIADNMILNVSAPATAPDIVAGIFVTGVVGSNTKVYYNSFSLTGNRGAVAGQIGSYGIAISGANPVVDIKDNIFYNTQTSGGGANAKSYSIGTASTTFTNMTSNNNDFFVSSANAGFYRTASLDTAGTDLATLAAWQGATGGDGASVELDPLFVGATTNLHIQVASPVQGLGVAIAGIVRDFDLEGRPAANTDLGADELLGTTAASVSLAGRVTTANGNGIVNCILKIEGGGLTQPRIARTGPFGYYEFTDLAAGQTYIVTIKSRRFSFAIPSRSVVLVDSISDFDFIAEPQE